MYLSVNFRERTTLLVYDSDGVAQCHYSYLSVVKEALTFSFGLIFFSFGSTGR